MIYLQYIALFLCVLSVSINAIQARSHYVMRKMYKAGSDYFDGYIELLSQIPSHKWISTKEQLPPERIAVLCLIPEEGYEIAVCVYEKEEGFYLSYDDRKDLVVEYWCRIPAHLRMNEKVKI